MNLIGKAVVLARGLGKRMRRADTSAHLNASQAAMADSGIKGMIPIGRPFLDYVLSGLADAGYSDICLVIGPEHDAVREHYRLAQPRRLRVYYAVQEKPLGTADAMLAAESFTAGEEFIVLNSDNFYPAEVLRTMREMGVPGAVMFDREALIANSNIPAERVRHFAYARVDAADFLADLVEKPQKEIAAAGDDVLVSMNCWRFSPEIFRYCRSVPLSVRGELELPEAVRLGVRSGMRLKIIRSLSGVLDLSVRGDITEVAARLKAIRVGL